MKILDTEIEFDFLDADDMQKFEEETKKVTIKCKEEKIIMQNISCSEAIRKECKIIDDFFDNVFGENVSKKIFKGKMNLNEHIKAFQDVVSEKIKIQDDMQKIFNKYLPNRENRRYNQYKGNRR